MYENLTLAVYVLNINSSKKNFQTVLVHQTWVSYQRSLITQQKSLLKIMVPAVRTKFQKKADNRQTAGSSCVFCRTADMSCRLSCIFAAQYYLR